MGILYPIKRKGNDGCFFQESSDELCASKDHGQSESIHSENQSIIVLIGA